jgi:uncharacterized membrane protein YbhN (UPF0104 family)
LILFILSKIIASVRLNYFLKSVGISISEKLNLQLYWLGMYYNLFLPGGIGGDGYKVFLLRKRFNTRSRKIISAIFLDRVTGMLALFVLLVILSYSLPWPVIYHFLMWLLIPLSITICYLLIRWLFPDFISIFNPANALSFGVQLLQLAETYFILLALNHTNNTGAYLFVFLISSIVAVIPFTIGGIGSRELTFLYGAQWLHLNVNASIAISLIFFIITAIVSLFGIVYSFNPLKLKES